jgi:hypothetical protein
VRRLASPRSIFRSSESRRSMHQGDRPTTGSSAREKICARSAERSIRAERMGPERGRGHPRTVADDCRGRRPPELRSLSVCGGESGGGESGRSESGGENGRPRSGPSCFSAGLPVRPLSSDRSHPTALIRPLSSGRSHRAGETDTPFRQPSSLMPSFLAPSGLRPTTGLHPKGGRTASHQAASHQAASHQAARCLRGDPFTMRLVHGTAWAVEGKERRGFRPLPRSIPSYVPLSPNFPVTKRRNIWRTSMLYSHPYRCSKNPIPWGVWEW